MSNTQIKVFINDKEYSPEKSEVTYEEVVDFWIKNQDDKLDRDNIRVAYKNAQGEESEGNLFLGDDIEVKDGTEFNVSIKEGEWIIIMNTEEEYVSSKTLTYQSIVEIFLKQEERQAETSTKDDEIKYEVLYEDASGEKKKGILEEGQIVMIRNGTGFTVGPANES